MSNEGIPGNGKSERGPSRASRERAIEAQDTRATLEHRKNALSERYRALQTEIMKLEADVRRGDERIGGENDARKDELAFMVRNELRKEIDKKKNELAHAENELEEMGENPAEYTVQ